MKLTSVLFDLDGTLLQTADDLGAALNHVLAQHDMPLVDAKAYTPEASNGSRGLLELGFGAQLKNYDFERLKQQLLQCYAENIAIHTQYFPQVAETLSLLNEQHIPWGIVTNKPEFLTTPLVKHFELLDNCQVVVSGDTVGVSKPDPKPMHFALQKLGVNAQDCLYVGDAKRDIEAGKNTNMPTASALYGYIDEHEDPLTWQADFNLTTFKQLVEVMGLS